MPHLHRALPILDYQKLSGPLKVLQRFLQIVGKLRLATVPPRNHWWHVTFLLTSRGLSTGPMPVGKGDFPDTFEIEFDLINHRLKGFDSWGHSFIFSLKELNVSEFYANLYSELSRIGIEIPIHAKPYKIEPHTPFEDDTTHVYSETDLITNYFDSLRFADHQLKIFSSGYSGKESPSQFFWHSMDIAISRFNGKKADANTEIEMDAVTKEAYSHELISFGYWAGDDRYPHPAFYSYAYPFPDELLTKSLKPKEAFWYKLPNNPLALLPYEAVRLNSSPGLIVQEFLQTTYELACESSGWQREEFDLHEVGQNNAEQISHQNGPSNLSTGH